jgi:hypothetical protein
MGKGKGLMGKGKEITLPIKHSSITLLHKTLP